ncbi:MAG: SMP-30/gluconolactonase/LRE family protein, partial [Phycisphaerales bacterium]
FANTFFYRVVSCFVPFPYAVKVSESRDIRIRNLHCYSNSKVSFDSTVYEADADVEVRDTEFAVLDISGDLPVSSPSDSMALLAHAKVERLCDGFQNIAGAAVDPQGNVYFADARKETIYRWRWQSKRWETVRRIPQKPVQLAFDRTGHLLVVAYDGKGTVLAFDPEVQDSEIITLKAEPAVARVQAKAVLPVNRWMGDRGFARDSTMRKPYHYVSPDSTVFIAAGEDFVSGAIMWGTKLSDLLRAFRIAPAAPGQPFYVTNEAELRTWVFKVGPGGTLSEPRLFAQVGGENVAVDGQGNVYIAAGDVQMFDASGKVLGAIKIPQRPTSLVFGGADRKTLFITARSALYSVSTR